jgi:hypothetical protein
MSGTNQPTEADFARAALNLILTAKHEMTGQQFYQAIAPVAKWLESKFNTDGPIQTQDNPAATPANHDTPKKK